MYMTRMIEVSKATNGFVLECRVPLKPNSKSTAKMDMCCGPSCTERQYVAKDPKEVADLIADIMPLLDGDYKTESEFDDAFKKATSDAEAEEGGES